MAANCFRGPSKTPRGSRYQFETQCCFRRQLKTPRCSIYRFGTQDCFRHRLKIPRRFRLQFMTPICFEFRFMTPSCLRCRVKTTRHVRCRYKSPLYFGCQLWMEAFSESFPFHNLSIIKCLLAMCTQYDPLWGIIQVFIRHFLAVIIRLWHPSHF